MISHDLYMVNVLNNSAEHLSQFGSVTRLDGIDILKSYPIYIMSQHFYVFIFIKAYVHVNQRNDYY